MFFLFFSFKALMLPHLSVLRNKSKAPLENLEPGRTSAGAVTQAPNRHPVKEVT